MVVDASVQNRAITPSKAVSIGFSLCCNAWCASKAYPSD